MIDFSVNQLAGKTIESRHWRSWLNQVALAARFSRRAELSIAVVSAAAMQRLNRQYRGKDRPTDVLSFAERDSRDRLPKRLAVEPLGEVIICYPKAVAQARAHGRPLLDEIQRLFVHGVLHLLGYDHQTSGDAARMEGLERKILKQET
ncbi:MAG: rRNA maturation RNase YbeY [Candidatus Buchananbacteria bacterium RIFCSPLOWO2_01_FULL_56_15]|uniref:Endoribonuclease YbeY n=2 Tax=Candidatus Buchananiibacteriota TaxID=1817903 RepID=A0A1G1YJQ7_9BACT|nr:MAG: rRNA maturation RNase YbeY [Candidatus Buchananbacteria bacterium RIFCSPHIGHO2_02_FULL_56_16]OGY54732.1 MAG: rRNA maturation RNase YbeY [Candidatus Buchananbacteria bacterium RIFCSPLOWO2_01_FULL_56_15]